MKNRGEKGFTLVELLIIIAILAIVAAVVIPNVTGMFGRGSEEALKTETDVIQTVGIFLLFVLMMYLLLTTKTKPELAFMDLFNLPAGQIISFFLAGFFIPMASPPDNNQQPPPIA